MVKTASTSAIPKKSTKKIPKPKQRKPQTPNADITFVAITKLSF